MCVPQYMGRFPNEIWLPLHCNRVCCLPLPQSVDSVLCKRYSVYTFTVSCCVSSFNRVCGLLSVLLLCCQCCDLLSLAVSAAGLQSRLSHSCENFDFCQFKRSIFVFYTLRVLKLFSQIDFEFSSRLIQSQVNHKQLSMFYTNN